MFEKIIDEINKLGFSFVETEIVNISRDEYFEMDKNKCVKKCCFDITFETGEMFCYYPNYYGKMEIVKIINVDEINDCL